MAAYLQDEGAQVVRRMGILFRCSDFDPDRGLVSLNLLQSKSQSAGSLIDRAINQGLRDRVENLSSEERDSYGKQAEDLSDEQKEQLKKLFGQ